MTNDRRSEGSIRREIESLKRGIKIQQTVIDELEAELKRRQEAQWK